MAVTTKYTFPNAVGTNNQSTTIFANHGIENFNQDNLDVYVTLSGGTRVLQYRQSTGSTTDSNHPQVNDTTGLYFPSVNTGVTLYNYTLSTDFNTITFNSELPTGAVVSVERRTRDENGTYTNFTSGSSIRSKEINNAFDESNHTAQEARNKAFDLENKVVYSDFTPAEDNTKDLGSSTKEWKDLYIDGVAYVDELDLDDDQKIKLGTSDDASIYWDGTGDELTHQLKITSAGPMKLSTGNNKNFQFYEGTDLSLTIGTAITAYVNVVPNADNTIDLGSSSNEWKDLYVDGTGYIDTVSGNQAAFSGNLQVGGTISNSGSNLELADDVNITGHLRFPDDKKIYLGNGDDAYIDWDTDGWFDRVNIRSDGDIWSYVPSGKNHSFLVNDAHVLSVEETFIEAWKDIKPNADGTIDLGASDKEWKDLYVDGVAYVDELDLGDNEKIKLGSSAGDAEIYYKPNDFLQIESKGSIVLDTDGGNFVVADDGAAKFGWTTNTALGVYVVDHLRPFIDNTYDLGSSSKEWKDLYVDGTGYIDTVSADDITGDAVVTSGTSTSDTKVYSAKHTEALFLRQDSTETLASGIAWSSNDTTVPTTGAIDARVRGLITDVGGFRPIASEAVFPTTNPDPDDNAGTIVSITALSADRTASGTTLTAGCQTTGGTQVTITGCPNNQVFKQGYGLLVETTSTLNTYTFVRYVADTSSVATVAAKATEIGLLGTADAIADMALLGTADVIADMNTLATADCVADMAILATTDVVADLNTLGTADVVSDLNTLATADVVSDMNTLATADVISDMNTLATADVVSDMNTLATAAIVSDMDTLADISANITTVATNNANVTTCATNIASIINAPTHAANALAYRNTTETYRNTAEAHRNSASAILTQVESAPYNLSDSASTHTAWGNITDTGGNAAFSNETSNTLLTMAEGSSTYNYGSIT